MQYFYKEGTWKIQASLINFINDDYKQKINLFDDKQKINLLDD